MTLLKEWILNFDHSIFFFFQHLQRPWLDYFLAWPTCLGTDVPALSLLVAGIFIFDKKRSDPSIPAALTAILMTDWLTPFLKDFFHRPRPHIYWEHVNILFSKPGNDAFPSGHAAIVFAAAFTLHHYYPQKMRWIYAAAVWIALTRIYVGAHYPTDLIGGALLGAACGWSACRLLAFPDSKKPNPDHRSS